MKNPSSLRGQESSYESGRVARRKVSRAKTTTSSNPPRKNTTSSFCSGQRTPSPRDDQEINSSSCCSRFVDQIESINVPFLTNEEGGPVPLISDLNAVVFGTVSAAEAISLCGFKPPQYMWFILSGLMCNVIQLLIDMALHFGMKIEDSSVCWTLSFIISIVARHTLHRYLVFGMYVGDYYSSLLRIYLGYGASIVLSPFFNKAITSTWLRLPHYVAWFVTLVWTGVFNFFVLKRLWNYGKTPVAPSGSGAGGITDSVTSSASTSGLRNEEEIIQNELEFEEKELDSPALEEEV